MSNLELTPERRAAAEEYTRLVQSYINLGRRAIGRTVYIPGEPCEESDYPGEGKNG